MSSSETISPCLLLDRTPADYSPGDLLRVESPTDALTGAQAVELSVVWCTVGKGDEDLFVHDFRRVSAVELPQSEPLSLETTLPPSPLSYAGRAVKVCWSARLRIRFLGGKQQLIEAPFRLGEVTPADDDNAAIGEHEA